MSNQVEVTIMGQSYLLACPAGGERALHRAVEQVDEEMCAIRDAGRIRARERIAVLAALNLAYQLAQVPAASASTPGEPSVLDIDGLIQRIDRLLGADGQLL
ncbi:cell division protein ZapA [Pseudorhodoferax sp.]|jgi:cell division protein ZapA|uniref:cell division protein ZapA n=1 Tax=Pseudorhodoferax sp. TaxID=1993553 RepID=UPI001B52806B|nr:cell division protein ZapA [Pseudorhodoferax sp.]MBP8145018.1 cell division protein ZapA [Inhella sp.]